MDDLKQIQRHILLRSIYVLVSPIFMMLAVLACAGTFLTDTPIYTCPTAMPLATSTTLAGTATPTAQAPATPYIIMPPADFYLGDAVEVGTSLSEHGVRFRLLSVAGYPASPSGNGEPRHAYYWQLEVSNIGTAEYEIFPSAQMVLTTVSTASGEQAGSWYVQREAGLEIGVTVDNNTYVMGSGETRVFNLVAFAPAGQAKRLTFYLDPSLSESNTVMTWLNQSNPYCVS